MPYTSKKGLLKFSIDGVTVPAPIGWQDITVLANWSNGNTQPAITATDITVYGEAAQLIRDRISGGASGGVGIFEGVPVTIEAYGAPGSYTAFEGYADLSDGFEDSYGSEYPESGKVTFRLKKKNQLDVLGKALEKLTYGYLESIGVFTQSDYTDVEYLVEKRDNALEILTTSITLFMMTKELAESSKNTAEAIIDVTTILTGGGTTGGLGAAVKAAGQALILAAYSTALLAAVIKLSDDLFAAFISPVRKHKAVTLDLLVSRVFEHLGYGFETDVPELSALYYVPVNRNTDKFGGNGFIFKGRGTSSGIPATGGFGYVCADMVNKVKQMFNCRVAIVENTVHLRNVESEFWKRRASYAMPDVRRKTIGYNTDELKANKVITFETDPADVWTIEDYTGNGYERVVNPITVTNSDAVFVSGLEDIKLPFAIGSRKDELNPLEKALSALGGVIDEITGVFGGGTSYGAAVKNRLGMLRQATNNHTVPKLLPLAKKGKLPADFKTRLSAKKLYEDHHAGSSFVANGFAGQKKIVSVPKLPFGLTDLLSVAENNYIYDADGNLAELIQLEYNINSDTASAKYYVPCVYTTNLREEFYEP